VVRSVPALAYVCTSGLTTGDADADEAGPESGRCIREDGRGGGGPGIAIGIALGGREGGGSVYAADRRAGAGSGTPSSARRLSTGTPACTTIIVSVCLQGGRGKGADADPVLDELGAEDLVKPRGAEGRVLRVGEARAQLLVLAPQRVKQRVGRGLGRGVGRGLLLRAAERGELAREAVDVRLGLVLERGLEVDLLLPELCGSGERACVVREGARTCSSLRERMLMIRSSSASYALIRSSSRLLDVDSRRGGGENDIGSG
jgi:hypothetical protein